MRLPTDRPRPAMQTFRGAKMPLTVSPALTAQLRAICRQEDATLFMLLLAALQALTLELYPLLIEMTGPVVVRRLAQVETLRRARLAPQEEVTR